VIAEDFVRIVKLQAAIPSPTNELQEKVNSFAGSQNARRKSKGVEPTVRDPVGRFAPGCRGNPSAYRHNGVMPALVESAVSQKNYALS